VKTIAVVTALAATATMAQNAPLVIAFQAPASTSSYYTPFLSYLPNISGIGVSVPWNLIDNCSATTHCVGQNDTCPSGVYQWCGLDTMLLAYINSGDFGGKKVVIIVYPENDSGGSNTYTPQYVFSSTWAASTEVCPSGGSCPLQDVAVCRAWQGNGVSVTGTFTTNNGAVWNAGACVTYPQPHSGLTCSGAPYGEFSGFPVVYEKPILVAYQDFLTALAQHYNPATGTTNGKKIAPYIAYVRAGMAAGGENNPICATTGITATTSSGWPSGKAVPAGYVVLPSVNNAGGYQFVADSAGTTGGALAQPAWCQSPGCYTGPDNTVSRWRNSGVPGGTSSGNVIWPGPQGLGGLEPQLFIDNGYLGTWALNNPTSGDGAGYIATMTSFLSSLNSSFPWDISSHVGPPQLNNVAYADAEATLAAANGIGFGMQSVNIGDGQALASGTFPTSRNDWVANFQKYPGVPVHHLQTANPGNNGVWWAGYPIGGANGPAGATGIVVTSGTGMNTATVYCASESTAVDCSPLANDYVYVGGNANTALNAVWRAACTSGPTCYPTFSVPTAISPGTYYGGNLWSLNYWLITMPFAVQHEASSIEVYECDLDYAFGGTTFPPAPDGCNPPPVGLAGDDPTYQLVLQNTLTGQPTMTSVHAGTFVGTNSTQF